MRFPPCLLALLLATGPLIAETPPFLNSVVSNDIDFIHSDDPAPEFEVISKGRGRREMPDRRSDELFQGDVYLFVLKYADDASVEVWAAPDLANAEKALHYTRLLGNALAKQPAAMRKLLHHVVIHKGDEVAFAEEQGRFFVLYSNNMDKRRATRDLEETVFHESVHAKLEAKHAKHEDWIQAQEKDSRFLTEYAQRLPEKEDLPESALFVYTLWKYPGRLSPDLEKLVRERIPHRLAYLSNLFDSMNPDPREAVAQD